LKSGSTAIAQALWSTEACPLNIAVCGIQVQLGQQRQRAIKRRFKLFVNEARRTITPREVAYLEISEDIVVRWFVLGAIEGYRKTPSARGRIRLYRDSVEQFDRQRKSQVPPRKL
jgi:hypothetical protein